MTKKEVSTMRVFLAASFPQGIGEPEYITTEEARLLLKDGFQSLISDAQTTTILSKLFGQTVPVLAEGDLIISDGDLFICYWEERGEDMFSKTTVLLDLPATPSTAQDKSTEIGQRFLADVYPEEQFGPIKHLYTKEQARGFLAPGFISLIADPEKAALASTLLGLDVQAKVTEDLLTARPGDLFVFMCDEPLGMFTAVVLAKPRK